MKNGLQPALVWPSSRTRLQVKSLIPAQSSKDFAGKGQYIYLILFPSLHLIISSCTMLRIWRNLRMNLRAWPRMGASLLLAEKLTKLPLAELGFCFVMLYPFHSTCAFPEPGIEPGTCDFRVRRASHSAAIRRPFMSLVVLNL